MATKTPKKQTPKYVTKPTFVALLSNGKVFVGARCDAAASEKGIKVVDQKNSSGRRSQSCEGREGEGRQAAPRHRSRGDGEGLRGGVVSRQTKSATQRDLERRIRKVLAWLDAEVSPEMIAEYRKTVSRAGGEVETALRADENAMRGLG